MPSVPISHLALVDEEEATGETAEIFADIRRVLGAPSAGIPYTIVAQSPAVLSSAWSMYKNFVEQTTLPAPLLFMMHYAISNARECQFCASKFEFACRSVGIEDAVLDAMIHDLDSINPARVREIIMFAVQCATAPQQLTQEDYDRLRDQGVTEEELVEIIGWSAVAMYNDTISDSMKLASEHEQEYIED